MNIKCTMLSERRQPKNVVYYRVSVYHILSFPGALVVKNTPANAGHIRDLGLIPGSRRSPEGGHGNPLKYSCLENPMDRGAWRATVYRVEKSQTLLKQLSIHTYSILEKVKL